MQPPPQPSARIPHNLIQDPRGFLLPRFVNAGHHLPAAHVAPQPASKNLQDSGRAAESAMRKTRDAMQKAPCTMHLTADVKLPPGPTVWIEYKLLRPSPLALEDSGFV